MQIECKVSGVESVLSILSEKKQSVVLVSALNTTATAAKKEIINKIKGRYLITKQKNLDMNITRANRNNYTATLGIPGVRQFLSLFKPQQNATGTSIEIVKGARKTITSAFIATMKSGHTGVFQRKDLSSSKSLPIKEIFTLSSAGMYSYGVIEKDIREFINKTLKENIEKKIMTLVNTGKAA